MAILIDLIKISFSLYARILEHSNMVDHVISRERSGIVVIINDTMSTKDKLHY